MPVLLCAACTPVEEPPSNIVGRLQNAKIDEASGLARSQRYPGVFWVANDDGPSVLYAIDSTGKDRGRVGDNDGDRKDVRIYVIEEPEAGDDKVKPAWRIEFTYPEGPRDAESVAVDVENERVLVLTKRDVPALLYSLPLRPDTKKRIDAQRLGVVASLPQPSHSDLEFADRVNSLHWQPTSLDIADDRRHAAVLTYGGVYLFPREHGESWLEAMRQPPLVVSRSANTAAIPAAGRP